MKLTLLNNSTSLIEWIFFVFLETGRMKTLKLCLLLFLSLF